VRHRNFHLATVLLAYALGVGSSHADDTVSPSDSFASDPSITIKYLPGKYYEQRAQDAVTHKNFRQALDMYEKAAWWGNKYAQYDIGMLYIHGADGVPVDKVRGTAWLGIAAQKHTPDVDKALGEAYGSLDASQKAEAGALWKKLKVDYDDKVTLDRASKKFNAQYVHDRGSVLGNEAYTTITYGDFGGAHNDTDSVVNQINAATNVPGTAHTVNAAKFLNAVKDQFSDFVRVQFGAVEVGQPETIPMPHGQSAPPAAQKKP
jgi:TPR repeat protein